MIMLSENKIKSVTMKYFCKYKFLKCKPDCYYFFWASIPMKVSFETELYFNWHESKFMRPIIIINASANFGDAVFILLRIYVLIRNCFTYYAIAETLRWFTCILNLSMYCLTVVSNMLINAKVKACYLFLNSFYISH